MAGPELNLGQLAGTDHKYELSLSNESPEDAQARREQEAAEAELRRKMAFGVFLLALAMTAVVFVGCVYVFVNGIPDDRKWAAGIVSAMASGLVGYLVGLGKR